MTRNYSFSRWLVQQSGRPDCIGAFARYVMADDDAPIGAYRSATWRRYLKQHNAPADAIEGITPAFWEFARRPVPMPAVVSASELAGATGRSRTEIEAAYLGEVRP